MARVIQVGSDQVILDGHRVIIDAARPIYDWSVREFCHHPIYFEGWKYLLVGKRRVAKPYAIRYELHAWPEDLHEASNIEFTYDADFVAARDRGARLEQTHTLLWYALLPLYPALGLFWSGFKERVLWPIGFVPTSITSASVMFTFSLLIAEAIFYGWLGGGFIVLLTGRSFDWIVHDWPDAALLIVLFSDCLVRASELMRAEVAVPAGFLEWLFRRR